MKYKYPVRMVRGSAWQPQSMWDVAFAHTSEEEKKLREEGYVVSNCQRTRV